MPMAGTATVQAQSGGQPFGQLVLARSPACGGRAHQPARAPGSRRSGIHPGAPVP
jgi:hypothetical protein